MPKISWDSFPLVLSLLIQFFCMGKLTHIKQDEDMENNMELLTFIIEKYKLRMKGTYVY